MEKYPIFLIVDDTHDTILGLKLLLRAHGLKVIGNPNSLQFAVLLPKDGHDCQDLLRHNLDVLFTTLNRNCFIITSPYSRKLYLVENEENNPKFELVDYEWLANKIKETDDFWNKKNHTPRQTRF